MIDGLTNWDCGSRVANPIYLGSALQMPNSGGFDNEERSLLI
jgi:hypothetical protein